MSVEARPSAKGATTLDFRLLEASPDAVVVVDADGVIVYATARIEQLLGWRPDQLLGQSLEVLVPAHLRELHREQREVFTDAARPRLMRRGDPQRALHRDGHEVPIDVALSPIDGPEGRLVVAYIRDSALRVQVLEQLRLSEARFRTLAEQATDGIFVSDAQGRYVDVNDAGCAMLGYSREELLALSIVDVVAPWELERVPRETGRLGDAPLRSEWCFRRRDGTTFDGEVNGRQLSDGRLLGVVRDITERKRQQESERRSARFIDSVARASSSWIYVFDIDDKEVRYLNRSILQDLGYSEEAARPTDLATFMGYFHPDDRQRLPSLLHEWRTMPDGAMHEGELRLRHSDGSYRTLLGRETVFARHVDGTVHQILGTLHDATALANAVGNLQESEGRYRALVDELDVGVVLLDVVHDGVLHANHAAQEALGMSAGQLATIGSRAWPTTLLHEDGTEYEPHERPSVVAARTGLPVHGLIVGSAATPPKVDRWLQVTAIPRHDAEGTVTQVVLAMTDITARKEAEDALRRAREEWEHSFNALTDWVCVLDRRGRIIRANAAMHAEFEPRLGPLAGRDLGEVYPEDGPGGASRLGDVLSGGPSIQFTTSLGRSPGHFVVSCHPLGPAGGAVHVVRDATHERLLEDQLRQSQKMQAIGQLAGGIAHDFNNLLTVIMMATQDALADPAPSVAASRDSLHSIHDAAVRASLLTRQLLLFGRKADWEEVIVDVNDVVQRSSQLLRRVLGAQISLALDICPEGVTTRADPAQLEQVVVNMALNARDSMPGGGELSIATRRRTITAAEHSAHAALAPGKYVELAIGDTGSGMTPDVMAHLFEPFFITKPPGKGTGLGLSTAYAIVQRAGGQITVESRVGAGTTFRVLLPQVDEPAGPRAVAGPPSHALGGSETVLLVDDEDAVRAVIARALRARGFRVIDVAAGTAALSILEHDERTVHVLVTDMVMPGMGGMELAERARAIRPELPVLFLSGYNPDAFHGAPLLGPATRVLQKPFDVEVLIAKVRASIDAATTAD